MFYLKKFVLKILKVYFIKNYNLFFETAKKSILKNYKVN